MGKSEAARVFGVSLSSVKRYVGTACEGSSLSPSKHPEPCPKLDEGARRLLEADEEKRPHSDAQGMAFTLALPWRTACSISSQRTLSEPIRRCRRMPS
jgi:transposase